jgi:hypothetical protein
MQLIKLAYSLYTLTINLWISGERKFLDLKDHVPDLTSQVQQLCISGLAILLPYLRHPWGWLQIRNMSHRKETSYEKYTLLVSLRCYVRVYGSNELHTIWVKCNTEELSRVIVAAGEKVLLILSVYVLSFSILHSHVACPEVTHCYTLSHKGRDFFKNVIDHKVCFGFLCKVCPRYFSFYEEFSDILS